MRHFALWNKRHFELIIVSAVTIVKMDEDQEELARLITSAEKKLKNPELSAALRSQLLKMLEDWQLRFESSLMFEDSPAAKRSSTVAPGNILTCAYSSRLPRLPLNL